MIRITGRRLLLGAAVVVGLTFWIIWPNTPVSGEILPPGTAPHLPSKVGAERYLGVASCSSMACHHFNGYKGTPRSEYSTWVAHDKHANAFAVLYNERSQRMVKNLYGSDASNATETALCLKCHSTNDGQATNAGDRFQASDGVGCEACHGPSSNWIAEHFKPGFQGLSDKSKEGFGFYPTKNLGFRAKVCASCHIGDGTKEVNHDLIAAGHPRLNFELGAYQGIYHKHWSIEDEKERHPDFQARSWMIGQVVAAREAIQLLRHRAEQATDPETPAVWPEFSEYECYACHQDLTVKTPEQIKARYKDRRPGSYRWQTWYITMLERLAKIEGVELKELPELRKEMELSSPSPTKVTEQADAVIKELDNWLAKIEKMPTLTAANMKTYFDQFLESGLNDAKGLEWDQSSQLYLSLAAMHHGLSDLKDSSVQSPDLRKSMKALQGKLQNAFQDGYDSPKFDPLAEPKLDTLLEDIRKAFGK